MNTYGNKLIDDFDVLELDPVREAFLDGAYFVYGHTLMQRTLGLGYQSDWANKQMPSRRDKNDFYTRVGRLVPPGRASLERIGGFDASLGPEAILNQLDQRI